MPHGTHCFTCRDCGKAELCGDCIPSLCYDCARLRDKAKAEGVEGRCKECGDKLAHDGTCFECRIFRVGGRR